MPKNIEKSSIHLLSSIFSSSNKEFLFLKLKKKTQRLIWFYITIKNDKKSMNAFIGTIFRKMTWLLTSVAFKFILGTKYRNMSWFSTLKAFLFAIFAFCGCMAFFPTFFTQNKSFGAGIGKVVSIFTNKTSRFFFFSCFVLWTFFGKMSVFLAQVASLLIKKIEGTIFTYMSLLITDETYLIFLSFLRTLFGKMAFFVTLMAHDFFT